MLARVADAFAGVGGMSLAFQRAGGTVLWQSECDQYRQRVLNAHFPGTLLYDDVRTIPDDAPSVDVLCAGLPCEGFSIAGRRRGLEDERSGLLYPLARVLDRHRPRWVLIENVPGLLSSRAGEDFAAVLRELAGIGYGLGWRVLRADWFGSPQSRPRLFIVGCLGDPVPPSILFGADYDRSSLEAVELDAGGAGEARKGSDPVAFNLTGAPGFSYAAPTITSAGASQVAVVGRDVGPRRLTPRECERLQGFPDDWTEVAVNGKHCGDGRRYEALGDAVCVPVVSWIAERILNG